MPKVKTVGLGFDTKAEIYVNSKGSFYCNVPDGADNYFVIGDSYANGSVRCERSRNGTKQIYCRDFDRLIAELVKPLRESNTPKIETEHVIRFNIESHVSFAVTEDGEIVPNAGWTEGAAWPQDDGRYGKHNAVQVARDGYSLTIGAKVLTKITQTYGDTEKIKYERYYKDGSNHGKENPAQMLNSWCSFSLPNDAREIPYSDEAALFFFDLMMGTAQLSKLIQDNTFDKDVLGHLIANRGQALLGFNGHGTTHPTDKGESDG